MKGRWVLVRLLHVSLKRRSSPINTNNPTKGSQTLKGTCFIHGKWMLHFSLKTVMNEQTFICLNSILLLVLHSWAPLWLVGSIRPAPLHHSVFHLMLSSKITSSPFRKLFTLKPVPSFFSVIVINELAVKHFYNMRWIFLFFKVVFIFASERICFQGRMQSWWNG